MDQENKKPQDTVLLIAPTIWKTSVPIIHVTPDDYRKSASKSKEIWEEARIKMEELNLPIGEEKDSTTPWRRTYPGGWVIYFNDKKPTIVRPDGTYFEAKDIEDAIKSLQSCASD